MTRDETNPTDQIQLHRTKGSDFLAAFVQFGSHCSCVVQIPATDNKLRTLPTEYAGDPRAWEQKLCTERRNIVIF